MSINPKLLSARFQIAFWMTYASCWCVAWQIDVPDTWWVLFGVVVRDCFGRHQTEAPKP
jgi:hypothetical protein